MARTYAFYKGTLKENPKAHPFDRLVCWWPRTRGRFSHAERVLVLQGLTYGLSSSARDHGVRSKPINFDSGRWEFVTVPGDFAFGLDKFYDNKGKGYDYPGLFGFVLPVWLHIKRLWFCSELCAAMEDLPKPHRWDPNRLYNYLRGLPGAKVRTVLVR